MKPDRFEYIRPESVGEAVKMYDEMANAKILAGGQSLVPLLRFRFATPDYLIDINGIDELSVMEETGDVLRMGALVRHSELVDSPLINKRYGALADAAPQIGDPIVRRRGTVGGSLAHHDPAGDWGAVFLAHGATYTASGPDGKRTITGEEFFQFPFETALEEDEILTGMQIPLPGKREGSSYRKLKRKVGDFATVGIAARLSIDDRGSIEDAGIGMTAVDVKNVRATDAEEILNGEQPTPRLFEEAGEAASRECNPESDNHGSEEYKRTMVRVLTQRALGDALKRTGVYDVQTVSS